MCDSFSCCFFKDTESSKTHTSENVLWKIKKLPQSKGLTVHFTWGRESEGTVQSFSLVSYMSMCSQNARATVCDVTKKKRHERSSSPFAAVNASEIESSTRENSFPTLFPLWRYSLVFFASHSQTHCWMWIQNELERKKQRGAEGER